jgi:hypothetical protein
MRKVIMALLGLGLVVGSTTVIASPCRDARGKFVKCPAKPAKLTRCRDAKGKFAKCDAKGAKPI